MSPHRKDTFLARRTRALLALTVNLAGAQLCESTGQYGWRTQAAARAAMLIAYRVGRPVYRVGHCADCRRWHIHTKPAKPVD